MVTDASGSVYFTESSTHVIRKVTMTNGPGVPGYMTIYAGVYGQTSYYSSSCSGSISSGAKFNYPVGLAFDANYANLYVTSYYSNFLQRIVTATQTVEVLSLSSSGSSYSLSGPYGISFDSSKTNLYIAEYGSSIVSKVTVSGSSGTVTLVAGTRGAWAFSANTATVPYGYLSGPVDVAVDSQGNLYIADYNNHYIRYIDSTNSLNVFAGIGSAYYNGDNLPPLQTSLNYPMGVTVSTDDDVYIVDTRNYVVRKVGTADQGTTYSYSLNGVTKTYTSSNAEVSFYVVIGIIAFTFLFGYSKSDGLSRKYFFLMTLPVLEMASIYVYVFNMLFTTIYMQMAILATYLIPGVYLAYHFYSTKTAPQLMAAASFGRVIDSVFGIASLLVNVPLQFIWFMLCVVLFQTSLWSSNSVHSIWMSVWSGKVAKAIEDTAAIDNGRLEKSLVWNMALKTIPQLLLVICNLTLVNIFSTRDLMFFGIVAAISIVNILNVMYYFFSFKPAMTRLTEAERELIKKNVMFNGEVINKALYAVSSPKPAASPRKAQLMNKKTYDMLVNIGSRFPVVMDVLVENNITDASTLAKNMTTSVRNRIALAIPSKAFRNHIIPILSNICIDIHGNFRDVEDAAEDSYDDVRVISQEEDQAADIMMGDAESEKEWEEFDIDMISISHSSGISEGSFQMNDVKENFDADSFGLVVSHEPGEF